jgi:VanZ family protein
VKSFHRLYILIWGLMLLAITVGSLLPVEKLPAETSLIGDKIQHSVAYALVGFMAILAGLRSRVKGLLLLISACVGVGIEFLQPLSGRHFEVADMMANASGLVIAAFLYFVFYKTKLKTPNKRI